MRDGIAFTLRQQKDMSLVGEATNGEEAIEAYRRYKPDVTLMDLQMPVMDGISATAAILDEFPQARIVLLTSYLGDIQATRALRIGARGYLLKGSLRTDLIQTIRQVHAGHLSIPPDIAQSIAANVGSKELSSRSLKCCASLRRVIPIKLWVICLASARTQSRVICAVCWRSCTRTTARTPC